LKLAHATVLVNDPTAFDPSETWSDDDAIDESVKMNVDDEESNMDLLKQWSDAEF